MATAKTWSRVPSSELEVGDVIKHNFNVPKTGWGTITEIGEVGYDELLPVSLTLGNGQKVKTKFHPNRKWYRRRYDNAMPGVQADSNGNPS